MDRKYRQQGYQDGEQESKPRQQPKRDRDGPRSPSMMAFRGVVRCAMCGTLVDVQLEDLAPESTCSKCGADLHTCRNCSSFDPSARFECRADVPKRIPNKASRNECNLFSPKKTVEKKTGETRTSAKDDPRTAFDKLFKN